MGFVGLFVTGLGTPVHVTVCLRGLFGVGFLTLFLAARRKLPQVRVLRETWVGGILLAISNALCILFYFLTIILSGFAVAAFLLYTGGLFAIVFMRLFHKEHISRPSIIAFTLAIIGVALIMEFWEGITSDSLGLLTGLLSGVFLGGNTFSKKMYFRKLGARMSTEYPDTPIILAWWATLTLGLIFLAPALYYFTGNPFPNIGYALLLGLIPTALAFTCFNLGLRADEGGDVLIFSYAEPVVATILSVVFGQPLTLFIIFGGSCIIAANLLVLFKRKTPKPAVLLR